MYVVKYWISNDKLNLNTDKNSIYCVRVKTAKNNNNKTKNKPKSLFSTNILGTPLFPVKSVKNLRVWPMQSSQLVPKLRSLVVAASQRDA